MYLVGLAYVSSSITNSLVDELSLAATLQTKQMDHGSCKMHFRTHIIVSTENVLK